MACALEILEGHRPRGILDDAVEVESTTPGIESMRFIGMKIKNMGMRYKALLPDLSENNAGEGGNEIARLAKDRTRTTFKER